MDGKKREGRRGESKKANTNKSYEGYVVVEYEELVNSTRAI